uniref:Uncharacterized protein n=1 Tax=Globodera pallida TaxID=36090 RepID=A0A183CRI9_GLOPA
MIICPIRIFNVEDERVEPPFVDGEETETELDDLEQRQLLMDSNCDDTAAGEQQDVT